MNTNTTTPPVISAKDYRFDRGPTGRAHIHLLGGEPLMGTSGICKIIKNIPPWWASGLAVKVFGVSDPKLLTKIRNKKATTAEIEGLKNQLATKLTQISGMSVDQFLELCDQAYCAHQTSLEESADAGTDLHADLERFVKDRIEGFDIQFPTKPYPKKIQPFIDWYVANVETPLWSEVHCYSEELWLGGISDFGFIDKKGMLGIMDFKSSKAAYPEQFWQCAGYDLQLSENGGFTADGKKVFDLPRPVDYYTILPFGMENPVPQTVAYDRNGKEIVSGFDTENCKDSFKLCLALYKKLPRD